MRGLTTAPRLPPTGEGLTRELRDSIDVHASAHHGAPPPPLPTGEGLPRELRDSIAAAHANGGVPALRTEVPDEKMASDDAIDCL